MVSNPGVDSPLVWVQARPSCALLHLCASVLRTALAPRTRLRPGNPALRCVAAQFRAGERQSTLALQTLCTLPHAPSRRLLTVRPLQEVAPRSGLDFAPGRERALVLRGAPHCRSGRERVPRPRLRRPRAPAQQNDGRDGASCAEAEDEYPTSDEEEGGDAAAPSASPLVLRLVVKAPKRLSAGTPDVPTVPAGWARATEGAEVVYKAPDGAQLRSLLQVQDWLQRTGSHAEDTPLECFSFAKPARRSGRGGCGGGAGGDGSPEGGAARVSDEPRRWAEAQSRFPHSVKPLVPCLLQLFTREAAQPLLGGPSCSPPGAPPADFASVRARLLDGSYDTSGRAALVHDVRRILRAAPELVAAFNRGVAALSQEALASQASARALFAPRRFFSAVRGTTCAVPAPWDRQRESGAAQQAEALRRKDAKQRVVHLRPLPPSRPGDSDLESDSEVAADPHAQPEPRSKALAAPALAKPPASRSGKRVRAPRRARGRKGSDEDDTILAAEVDDSDEEEDE